MNDEPIPSGLDLDLLKKRIAELNEEHKVDLSEYKYIFDDPNRVKKQTEFPHEIHISLTANILKNVDGAEFPESESVCVNNYYIPVPSGNDYQEYVKVFFDYIENCMNSSASDMHNKEATDNEQ